MPLECSKRPPAPGFSIPPCSSGTAGAGFHDQRLATRPVLAKTGANFGFCKTFLTGALAVLFPGRTTFSFLTGSRPWRVCSPHPPVQASPGRGWRSRSANRVSKHRLHQSRECLSGKNTSPIALEYCTYSCIVHSSASRNSISFRQPSATDLRCQPPFSRAEVSPSNLQSFNFPRQTTLQSFALLVARILR